MITLEDKISELCMPSGVDNRAWCSPIESQGRLGSCTAHAGIGIIEYLERKTFDKHLDASRLFLYKTTRNLLNWTGDTGAYLRTTMKALRLFGIPPEEYYTYRVDKFDEEPSAFVYALAQNYKSIEYYRLDTLNNSPQNTLESIKKHLVAGIPSMFGFSTYHSIWNVDSSGKIYFPNPNEPVVGGHALVAIGYNDDLEIVHYESPFTRTIGAFLVRNSWGTGWGQGGYGYLPYDYVTKGIATDWWVIIKQDWVDTEKFNI